MPWPYDDKPISPLINALTGGQSAPAPQTEEIWGPKFQALMSHEYNKAVAGSDLSTQYDILASKYHNSPSDTPQMREAIRKELVRLQAALGPEWMQRYAPNAVDYSQERAIGQGLLGNAVGGGASTRNRLTNGE